MYAHFVVETSLVPKRQCMIQFQCVLHIMLDFCVIGNWKINKRHLNLFVTNSYSHNDFHYYQVTFHLTVPSVLFNLTNGN